jgi:transcriptional regulator with XRE-family HTH domain
MTIYNETDLRQIITALVQEARGKGFRMTFERLAKAARVQKAHITNVLKGRASFQSDQLYMICKELKLSKQETKYLLLLLDHERSVVPERKAEIALDIEQMQNEHLQTEKYLQAEVEDLAIEKQFPRYYLDPVHQIVHIALSIDKFAQNPKLLEPVLGIAHERIVSILDALESHGIIAQKLGRWTTLKKQVHLKRNSDLYPAWKMQMQNLGQARNQLGTSEKSYGFAVIFSADDKARKRIQTKLLELITEIEPLVVKAPAQNVYQLSLDLLPWTDS